jgi:hypothetical protein
MQFVHAHGREGAGKVRVGNGRIAATSLRFRFSMLPARRGIFSARAAAMVNNKKPLRDSFYLEPLRRPKRASSRFPDRAMLDYWTSDE